MRDKEESNSADTTHDKAPAGVAGGQLVWAKELVQVPAAALGNLFFLSHPWLGLLLWAALATRPRYAGFALLGLIVGETVERLLQLPHATRLGGGIKVNALLAALMVGWLTQASSLSLSLQLAAATASATGTAILAAAIMRGLTGSRLPSLVWAYCLVSAALFSLFPAWVDTASATMPAWPGPADAAGWLITFTRSLGSLLFKPDLLTGLMIGAAILLWSRIMFISGVFGWAGGTLVALFCEHLGLQFHWLPVAYNFFLAGMALGCVFFLPGRASLLIAFLAGSVAAFVALLLQLLMPGGPVPYLPISTAATIWIGMSALTLASGKNPVQLNPFSAITPEKAWWQSALWNRRFGRHVPLLAVPVSAPVQITQAFDGHLSHVGQWRHALDFQFPRHASAATPAASIWDCPVLSPAAGIVERVRNDVPDNPLGVSNYADNWGNHVVIRLDQGGWAMLAHLRQGSITVTPGGRVETGSYLGTVGNSGRSPVPHLHLQAQSSTVPGAATSPFLMANYLSSHETGGELLDWHPAGMPAKDAVIMAAAPLPLSHRLLTSTAPGTAIWVVESVGKIPRPFRPKATARSFRVTTQLADDGSHLFTAASGGSLVVGHAPDAWRVLQVQAGAHPLLKLLGLAAPSIPYAAFAGVNWRDISPLMPGGPGGWLRMALSPYFGDPFKAVHCNCSVVPNDINAPLEIQTDVLSRPHGLPLCIDSEFAFLRGPVKLRAEFPHGKVVYTQLSFEPGMPLNGQAAR